MTCRNCSCAAFLSTPSARRATAPVGAPLVTALTISIHALREEGDAFAVSAVFVDFAISIHALREEGDLVVAVISEGAALFLSTPSARRATVLISPTAPATLISIHALREEGDCRWSCRDNTCAISIHALREEGDAAEQLGRTAFCMISIHALREEGDP